MGKLFYGNAPEPIEVSDRMLAHIKVVVATKLRRSESFTMTWTHGEGEPTGRSTIWFQPSIPLRFTFDTAETEKLDSALLTEMARAASSSSGLIVDVHEQAETAEQSQAPAQAPTRNRTRGSLAAAA